MAIERTLSIVKPDAVAKNAIGAIVARFEDAGLDDVLQWLRVATGANFVVKRTALATHTLGWKDAFKFAASRIQSAEPSAPSQRELKSMTVVSGSRSR